MEYSHKFRIYPNRAQEKLIQKTFGCCRFVWNHYLAERMTQYEQTGKTPTRFQQDKDMTRLKKELTWLCEADSTALRSSLFDLDVAYQNFFRNRKKKWGYPKFKSKKNPKMSYTTKSNIKVFDRAIQLPKLGKVKCRISKTVKGRILNATVSQNPAGKYFVALCCTDVEIEPLPSTGKVTGIDAGIKSLVVTADGTIYPNHKYLEKSLKKLARLQRRLSRKPKDSKRREKAKLNVARLHEHVANQRKDMLHKLSTDLVRKYDFIVLEDLGIKDMMQDHLFALRIADVSWYELRRQLEYKAKWYGKKTVAVDRTFPSSQLCFDCGFKNPVLKDLRIRKWTCPCCGAQHDRDINAAKNILREGLRLSA